MMRSTTFRKTFSARAHFKICPSRTHNPRSFIALALLLLAVSAVGAQPGPNVEIVPPKSYRPIPLVQSAALQAVLDTAVSEVLREYAAKGVKPDDIAVTVIDLTDAAGYRTAAVRGDARVYPASVVKLFYLAAVERQIEDGKIWITDELERGIRDMIVDSSNEAAQYILDVLTETSSGAELPKKQFDAWQFKRNRVNRYFASMGYANINVNQKTFCEDAYGIEQQSRAYKGQNRNMVTTNAAARLMAEIVTGRLVSPELTANMTKFLRRDPFAKPGADDDDQSRGFAGRTLIDRKMTGARLFSKAGWTTTTRHDVAYIETADHKKLVIAIFTERHSGERGLIPAIAGKLID